MAGYGQEPSVIVDTTRGVSVRDERGVARWSGTPTGPRGGRVTYARLEDERYACVWRRYYCHDARFRHVQDRLLQGCRTDGTIKEAQELDRDQINHSQSTIDANGGSAPCVVHPKKLLHSPRGSWNQTRRARKVSHDLQCPRIGKIARRSYHFQSIQPVASPPRIPAAAPPPPGAL